MAEEEQQVEETPAEEKPKKSINMLTVGLVLQMVAILGALGVVIKVVMFAPKPELSAQKVEERVIASIRDSEEEIRLFDIEEIIVNIDEGHTLKAKLVLELSNAQVEAVISQRLPVIRARLIQVLSNQSYANIDRIQGKLALKDKLAEVLNEELSSANFQGEGLIREIYFDNMVLL